MSDKSICTEDGFVIVLPTELEEPHLSDYFYTFGPTQSEQIHDQTTHSNGFVKFEEAEAAENALGMERHTIDDCYQDEPSTDDEFPIELINLTDLEEPHLSDYFSTFGPPQNEQIHDQNTHSIGYVKFEEAEAAENALGMERLTIDGRVTEVEIADDCYQDEPSTNDEFPIELINLTDLEEPHLSDNFSTFGPLQSVPIHDQTTHSIGSVKFEEAEPAENASKMERHTIDGRAIDVEIADNFHQDEPSTNDELPIELTNLTGTQFMDLNDYCLRKILTQVSAMDLCSISELADERKICRLKDLTNKVFARRFKTIELNKTATKYRDIERLLLSFGSLMYYVRTDGGSDSDGTIKLILIFCTSLKWLDLINVTFDESSTWALKDLFKKLEHIYISNCRFKGGTMHAFARCRSLLTLKVYDEASNMWDILQYTFPKLITFYYVSLWTARKTAFHDFISRHKGLTSIRVLSSEDESRLLPVIVEHCADIQDLAISSSGDESGEQCYIYESTMPALKKLKTLAICCDRKATRFIRQLKHLRSLRELILLGVRFNSEIKKFLGELKTLEVLILINCGKLTDFDVLAELTGLKKLHITSHKVATFDLLYIVRRLLDLKILELELKTPFVIDNVTQYRILAARRTSGRAKGSLQITCNGITTCISPPCRLQIPLSDIDLP